MKIEIPQLNGVEIAEIISERVFLYFFESDSSFRLSSLNLHLCRRVTMKIIVDIEKNTMLESKINLIIDNNSD